MTYLREAAKRGAEFLDERQPGWASRINLRQLDLSDCVACVLGQLYGHYGTGLEAIGLQVSDGESYATLEWKREFDQRYEFGFSTRLYDAANGDADIHALTACWKDEIRARRSKP